VDDRRGKNATRETGGNFDNTLGGPGLVRSRMIIDKGGMCERGSIEIKLRELVL